MGAARFTSSVALGPREVPHAAAWFWRHVILDGGLPLAMSLDRETLAEKVTVMVDAPAVVTVPIQISRSWPA